MNTCVGHAVMILTHIYPRRMLHLIVLSTVSSQTLCKLHYRKSDSRLASIELLLIFILEIVRSDCDLFISKDHSVSVDF